MHHIAQRIFSIGTWFSAFLYFIDKYIFPNADTIYTSIISIGTLVLLVLQISNQLHIWKERRNKKKEK